VLSHNHPAWDGIEVATKRLTVEGTAEVAAHYVTPYLAQDI